MLILINAVKAITRSKGRNILIMLIVAVIAGASAVALSIRHAAAEAETSGRDALTITATIGLDRQSLFQDAAPGAEPSSGAEGTEADRGADMDAIREALAAYPDLTLDQLLVYADSDLVADFRYSASLSVDTTGDIEAVSTETDAAGDDQSSDDQSSGDQNSDPAMPDGLPGGMGGMGGGSGPMRFGGVSMGDLTLTGYGSESAMTEFTAGASQISDGAMIDLTVADNACLVSEEFATFNGLAVGDTLTVANPAATDETYELTIAGLYSSQSSSQTTGLGGMIFSTSQDPANQLIVSAATVEAIEEASAAVATDTTDSEGRTTSTGLTGTSTSTFVFANPDDYTGFEAELRAQGLDEAYALTSTDLESYEASLVPLQNLSSFATTLLWIVLGVGAVIVVTIAIFSIRERKYEVGVLTAIGVAKPKVALQFVAEMFLVTVAGLVVGLGIGAAVSPPVADNLLSAQVAQQEAQTASVDVSFGRGGQMPGGAGGQVPGGAGDRSPFGQAVDYVSQINATLDWSVVGQLAGIGLGLALIASLAGVVFVLRYEPLTILANRS